MMFRKILLTGAAVLFVAPVFGIDIGAAHAQLMGTEGWAPPTGNNTFYAQSQALHQQQSGTTTSASSVPGTLYQNNYSSTTVGNIDTISQTLAQGANAYLAAGTNQTTTGNQTAAALGNSPTGNISSGGYNPATGLTNNAAKPSNSNPASGH